MNGCEIHLETGRGDWEECGKPGIGKAILPQRTVWICEEHAKWLADGSAVIDGNSVPVLRAITPRPEETP
jgi:hypothetical protein